MKKLSGKLITFEGGEGVGKTTLIENLESRFRSLDLPVLVTREPGGCRLSEKIRNLLLDVDAECPVSAKAELLLFLASRSQHIEQIIIPALKNGYYVLCDRFNDSSIAYQGYARGLGVDFVQNLTQTLFGELSPALTFFLDLDPISGLARSKKMTPNNTHDRIETESTSFHHKVREGFCLLACDNPDRFVTIDASADKQQLFEQAWFAIDQRYQLANL